MLKPEEVGASEAGGRRALGPVPRLARASDMRATALDVRNSGDTAGLENSVVGYGALATESAGTARIGEDDRARLPGTACMALGFGAKHGRPPRIRLAPGVPPSLTAMRARFVTLKIGGQLRGCTGSV